MGGMDMHEHTRQKRRIDGRRKVWVQGFTLEAGAIFGQHCSLQGGRTVTGAVMEGTSRTGYWRRVEGRDRAGRGGIFERGGAGYLSRA